MKEVSAVKKLQKSKKFDQALQEYLELYGDSVREGDLFASGLFMDEIVQTLLLKAEHPVSEPELRRDLREVLKFKITHGIAPSTGNKNPWVTDDDIEIAIRKRFPEHHRVQEFTGPEKETKDAFL